MTSDVSPEELILWLVCPVVFLFGMVGNVITLVVMYRLRHHFLTFAYYFAALSLSDSMLLVFSMLPRWAESLTKLRFEVKDHLMCKIDAVVHYAAFIASSWFLAGLAAHRAAVVLWPYSVGSPYAQPVAKLLISMVAASSGLMAFFMLSRDDMNFEDCYFGSAIKLRHKGPEVWFWVDSALIFFLPCIVIVGANVVIMLHLIASDDQVLMEYTNAAVNFYLYCLTGERFRKETKNIRYIHMRRRSSEPEEEESGGQTPVLVLSVVRVDSSCSRSSILKRTRSTSSVRKTVSFQDEKTAFLEDTDAQTLTFPLQPHHGKISETKTEDSIAS
ncbi:growth hormone secretagogue receptor type 1-like [Littorina saxatilis]|uniref:growth hormone secretagogue receptor type 1-like n=1 Tax=Littorina saxatilis TaxID=31220 RepID=UPI0038B65683